MAALHAFSLANNSAVHLKRVYTYGQPRTGNAAYADAFDARLRKRGVVHYRVTNYRDPVPHLPLQNFLFEGWKHSGMEVYYNVTRVKAYHVCKDASDRRCSEQWAASSSARGPLAGSRARIGGRRSAMHKAGLGGAACVAPLQWSRRTRRSRARGL